MDEKKTVKARLGVDLGTTNSAVCFRLEDTGEVDFLKVKGCDWKFFPSMVAYHKEDGSIRIGEQARKIRFSKKYDSYDTFKLSLGKGAHDCGGRARSPLQVTRDFISQILASFEELHGIKAEDVVLVHTVPEVWKREIGNQTALEHLTEAYDELEMDTTGQVSFESEPISAAAYYLNEVCKGKYSGYLIVVDYGGGTLDLTLCRADENGTIEALWSCGNGGTEKPGCAGNAFDQAAVKTLVQENDLDEDSFTPGLPAFEKLQTSFEYSKIASVKATQDALNRYYVSEGMDDPKAFTVVNPADDDDEYAVYASTIHNAFMAVNYHPLCDAVRRIQERCRLEGIDTADTDQLRVLLVGGFSNLYCVERTVRDLFGSDAGLGDSRFDNGISQDRRSLAISHGACLIAADITPVVHINQNEIGFYARNTMGDVVAVPVIQRGKPVREYMEPTYSPHTVTRAFHGMPVSLELYFDDGYGKVRMRMDDEFRTICPNYDTPGNTYRIGFSIDRHRIPQLHIRDAGGEEAVVSLYKIISRLPAASIHEDESEVDA